MKKRVRRILTWVGIPVVLIGGYAVFASTRVTIPTFSSITVEPMTFIQSVEETGVIDTQVSITYGWETNGRVVSVSKEVGDMVTSTDIIARLDDRDEVNALRQAQAQLSFANARLIEALADPTEEEKLTYQARIAQAEASLAQAQTDLENTRLTVAAGIADAARDVAQAEITLQQSGDISQGVQDAYDDLTNTMVGLLPNMRDALLEADAILGVDNTFGNDSYEEVLSAQNLTALTSAQGQYTDAKQLVDIAETSVLSLGADATPQIVDSAATDAQLALLGVNTLLQDTLTVLNATLPLNDLTQTALDVLRSGIITEKTSNATDRATLTNAVQAVTSAKNTTDSNKVALEKAIAALETANRTGDQKIASAERLVELRQASLAEANASYDALIAPPRDVDVAALRADVARYVASRDAAQAAVDDMVLTALTDGTITLLDISVGETVTAGQNIVTIQSNDRKIEVDISESDIAKVEVGDRAMIELDAYDNIELDATVTKIDPAATEISGVVYYKTTLEVDVPMELDVRPGMTADVKIITESKEDAIAVPRRAILTDGGTFVRVLTDTTRGTFDLREVTVGISGDDGMIEIVSGLSGGEEIITFIEE